MERGQILLGITFMILLLSGCARTSQGSTSTTSGGTIDLQACLNGCDSLSGAGKILCREVCYSKKAIETKDPITCDPVKTEGGLIDYGVCLQDLGKSVRSAEPCKRVASAPLIYNICVLNIATKIKDPSLCSLIVETTGYKSQQDACAKGTR